MSEGMNLMKRSYKVFCSKAAKSSLPLICAVFIFGFEHRLSAEPNDNATRDAAAQPIAQRILGDQELRDVLHRAKSILGNGFNAGDGYSQVWIRDFSTFMELSCEVNNPVLIKENLLRFFEFQGADGNIPDGFQKVNGSYVTNKNTVETDQESSLIQAIYKYVQKTGDVSVLTVTIDGRTVLERMELALEFLLKNRFSEKYGLLWGATTADWGDIQSESDPGLNLDEKTHKAIDIYDNAMFMVAVSDYLSFLKHDPRHFVRWHSIYAAVKKNSRNYLWDRKKNKFIPHLYLDGSPFPASFDEREVYYHGGTAVGIEAGLLSKKEIVISLSKMISNVRNSGAPSIGLSIYPCYPKGFFQNPAMTPYCYQNGGDWTWWGGRMIQQLIKHDLIEEAYREIKPMVKRVEHDNGFYEWYSIDNKPMGSGTYRGAAGVLGKAIEMLLAWAEAHSNAQSPDGPISQGAPRPFMMTRARICQRPAKSQAYRDWTGGSCGPW